MKTSMLYSRFPAGGVGLALLLLRLVDGLGLVGEVLHLVTPGESETASLSLLSLALGTSALLLILGLRTPLAGSAAAICTAGAAVYATHYLNLTGSERDAWFFLFAIVFFLSGSLALLGPGCYSLDARLSGWRMIELSPGKSDSRKEGEYVDR